MKNTNGTKKNIIGNKHGFTLVEIIVVLVLVTILATVGTLSLAAYVREQNFRRNEACAQSIYVAAQNALTHYKVSGELADFAEKAISEGEPVTSEMLDDPDFGYKSRIYAIMKTSSEDSENTLIGELLGGYIYDSAILNAAICIEFDPKDGVVYSVTYSDAVTAFYYGSSAPSYGSVSISDRTEAVRKELMFGYYGAGTLSAAAPTTLGKPVISKLELVNSETLYLRWLMSDNFKSITNTLKYTVKLYDASDDSLLMSFTLNDGDDSQILLKGYGDNVITCEVSLYNGENTVTKNMRFVAYAADGECLLVFDAADIAAAHNGDLSDTSSFKRFGINAEKIYVKVQASGVRYESSVWKSSNIETPLFGSVSESGGKKKYTIANARHLFNIRFTEEGILYGTGFSYVQTASFGWGGDDGIIAHGGLYDGFEPVTDRTAAFPTVNELSTDSSYISERGGKPTDSFAISKLNLGGDDYVGLFSRNQGSISYLTLTDVSVSGDDWVGSVCAVNSGDLSHISVGGYVTGDTYVGGIVGVDNGSSSYSDVVYSELSCSAEVRGNMYVGGITGYSNGSPLGYLLMSVTYENCTFTGSLYVVPAVNEHGQVWNCAGGIIGYNYSAVIRSCDSVIHRDDIDGMMPEDLYGTCVGGIVGYNSVHGEVTDCTTGSATESGYVVGKTYVGGIIGYQDTTIYGLHWWYELEGGSFGSNRSYVIAERYAGGIVGIIWQNMTVSDWLNQGVVCATSECSGGITGYNEGYIDNCESRVNTGSETAADVLEFLHYWGGTGDFSGGIAGFNNGTVSADKVTSVSAIVCGRNYVGGVVGFNDLDSHFDHYFLGGGYVEGESFVGGVIGLNRCSSVFSSVTLLKSMPNCVSGSYYVGGVIGANILSALGNITASFVTDNFLGSVDGGSGAFTGGFIGYIKLLPYLYTGHYGHPDDYYNYSEYIEQLTKSENETLETFINRIDTLNANSSYMNSNASFSIASVSGSDYCRLSSVKGGLYTGGLVGYTDEGTKLNISNYTNNTPVSAFSYVTDASDGAVRYSYCGGIIGLCQKNTLLFNCKNGNNVSITTSGTYTGELAELNKGIIRSCTAQSFGSSRISYVGGLVGRNEAAGRIEGCSLGGTVTGKDIVGGLAAVNLGVITRYSSGSVTYESVIGGTVSGSGGVGGAAGLNKGQINNISVKSASVICTGDNTGAVAGVNEGLVSYCSADATSSVSGKNVVGGIIGLQSGGNSGSTYAVSNVTFSGTVTGTQSYTGGIIGKISSSASLTVYNLSFKGTLTAKAGNAGGIVSESNSYATVKGCDVSGTVTALKGLCGGISAVNSGVEESCTLGGSGKAYISGIGCSGGITAVNYGTISAATISAADISDIKGGASADIIGGIAGLNSTGALIEKCAVSGSSAVNVFSYVNGSSIGGVSGKNLGTVCGDSSSKMTVGATLSFGGALSSQYTSCSGFTGGITGENSGSVIYCGFTGTVTGNGGSAYGCGGICGINRASASVTYCTFSGTLTVKGTVSDAVNVGGISGVNEKSGIISYSGISNCTVTADYGYIGGLVGHNYGNIINCLNDGGTVTVTANEGGDIGGIVGRNEQYGQLTYCSTGGNWTVKALKHQPGDTIGGIIGRSLSSLELSKLTNNANVTKLVNDSKCVGGIIGSIESRTLSFWKLSSCINNGTLTGYSGVGGIAAAVRYNGGTIENCTNNGIIRFLNESGTTTALMGIAGGIAAQLDTVASGGTVIITGCSNFADINGGNGKNLGGILGMTDSGATAYTNIRIIDCVNTGNINGSDLVSGIYANNGYNSVSAKIIRCRNYGRSSSSTFSGICSYGSAVLTNCFGVANSTDYPLLITALSDENAGSSYYFGRVATWSSSNNVTITSLWDDGITDLWHMCYNLIDHDYSTYWSSRALMALNGNTGATMTLTAAFSKATNLTKFSMCWYKNNRTYYFRLKYVKSNSWSYNYLKVNGNNVVFTGHGTNNPSSSTADTYDLSSYGLTNVEGIKLEVYKITGDSSGWVSAYELSINGVDDPSDNIPGDVDEFELVLYPESDSDGGYTAQTRDASVSMEDVPINPNMKTGSAWTYTSAQLYNSVDPILVQYYKTSVYTDNPQTPTNLVCSDVGGGYEISWTYDQSVYSYEVTVSIPSLGYSLTKTVTDASSLIWMAGDSQMYSKTATVNVVACGTESSVRSSAATSAFTVLSPLPQPDVYAELYGTSDSSCVRFILRNKSDYAGLNCKVYAMLDSSSVEINLSTGYSAFLPVTENGYQTAVYTSYAEFSDGTRAKSQVIAVQSYAAKPSWFSGNATVSASFGSFSGISNDTLKYNFTLLSSNCDIYYRSELLLQDDAFGYVASSSVISGISASGSSVSVALPVSEALLETADPATPVIVRSYPWHTQNDALFFGHIVAESVTRAEIMNYPEAYSVVSYDGDNKPVYALNNGYVVELIGEADGERLYKVLYSTFLANGSSVGSYYAIQVLKPSAAVSLPNQMPYPDIENITVTGTSLSFKWDTSYSYTNAKYTVMLYGYTSDGTESELFSSSDYALNTLSVNASAWSYSSVKLIVERLGTETNEVTTFRSAIAKKVFDVKISLSQITAPTVSLYNNDKNNLIYTVSWLPSENAAEQSYISGYTVYAVLDGDDTKFLKVSTADASYHSATINLEADGVFSGGDNIKIYVVANAFENEEGEYTTPYKDSDPGVAYTMQIPTRMTTPGTGNLLLNKTFSLEAPVYISEFENTGFTVSMTSTDTSSGGYIIEALLYPAAVADPSTLGTAENPAVKAWAAVSMTGTFLSSTYSTTGLSADYSGYYLYVRIRSAADNRISSLWTAYKEFRLPAVKPDAPVITAGTVTSFVTVSKYDPTAGNVSSENTGITQDKLTFASVEYAKSYSILLTGYYGNPLTVTVKLNDEMTAVESVYAGAAPITDVGGVYYIDDKTVCLPLSPYICTYQTRCSLSVQFTAQGAVFTLVLPDVLMNYGGYNSWLLFTSSASVTGLPSVSDAGRYGTSDAATASLGHSGTQTVYQVKQSFPTSLAVTENAEKPDDWKYDVSWLYSYVHDGAAVYLASFDIGVVDSLDSPTAYYNASFASSPASVTVPSGTFSAGQTVYFYVIAKAVSGGEYADSVRAAYVQVTLPLLPPSADSIALSKTYNDTLTEDEFTASICLTVSGSLSYEYEAYITDSPDGSGVHLWDSGGVYSASTPLGVTSDMAGKYMTIRVRSLSGALVSAYSEYKTVRLPKLS